MPDGARGGRERRNEENAEQGGELSPEGAASWPLFASAVPLSSSAPFSSSSSSSSTSTAATSSFSPLEQRRSRLERRGNFSLSTESVYSYSSSSSSSPAAAHSLSFFASLVTGKWWEKTKELLWESVWVLAVYGWVVALDLQQKQQRPLLPAGTPAVLSLLNSLRFLTHGGLGLGSHMTSSTGRILSHSLRLVTAGYGKRYIHFW
jgi:hypothetical protein